MSVELMSCRDCDRSSPEQEWKASKIAGYIICPKCGNFIKATYQQYQDAKLRTEAGNK